jgi:UDP-apiose/xylose synthase
LIGVGGYIGSHLLERLLPDASVHVDGWDPDCEKIADYLHYPNFDLRQTTLTDPETQQELRSAIERADGVINLAAICNPALYNADPVDVIQANFLESYPLVEMCAEFGKWLIHFSTSEVYGRTIASYLPDNVYSDPALYELDEDESPLVMGPIANQRWTYATSKQLLERYIFAHHKSFGLPFTIIRPLNFFGPRMDFIPGRDGEGVPRVLACFMTALMDGEPMKLVDGGTARRTIVSIEDAMDAIMLVLEKRDRAINQILNIGNRDNEVTMAELAELMRRTYARITGESSYESHPIENVSSMEFYGEGYEDCDRRMPNLDKARDLLGWAPRISLEETLLATMTYYHEKYAVPSALFD